MDCILEDKVKVKGNNMFNAHTIVLYFVEKFFGNFLRVYFILL